jgi:hypothetical protein
MPKANQHGVNVLVKMIKIITKPPVQKTDGNTLLGWRKRFDRFVTLLAVFRPTGSTMESKTDNDESKVNRINTINVKLEVTSFLPPAKNVCRSQRTTVLSLNWHVQCTKKIAFHPHPLNPFLSSKTTRVVLAMSKILS